MQRYTIGIFSDGSVSAVDDSGKATLFQSFRERAENQTLRAYKNEQLAIACAVILREELSRMPVPESS
jgi:hypothetical protein